MRHLPIPVRPFDTVDVDFVRPLPTTTAGNKYVLVAVDRFTGYPVAVPTRASTALAAANALYDHVICEFGMPQCVHSDRGTHFKNQLWGRLCNRLGITQTYTTSYHPRGNGKVEHFNGFLTKALATLTKSRHQDDWDRWIPPVLFAYRTSVHPRLR